MPTDEERNDFINETVAAELRKQLNASWEARTKRFRALSAKHRALPIESLQFAQRANLPEPTCHIVALTLAWREATAPQGVTP